MMQRCVAVPAVPVAAVAGSEHCCCYCLAERG